MRKWLIHFSVPVLHGILDAETYFHLTLFVTGISTLVKDCLTLEDIDFAERCLLDLCKVYPEIYGEYSQTMNLHLVRHLPRFVRMYGPLFGYSCFGFESLNPFLKDKLCCLYWQGAFQLVTEEKEKCNLFFKDLQINLFRKTKRAMKKFVL